MTEPSMKAKQLPLYRPIAPSMTTSQPQPLFKSGWDDIEKRKWNDPDGVYMRTRTGSVDSDGDSMHSKLLLGEGSHALTAEQKVRRKEQNRAAQRAFRERKERHVKELETKIKFLEETHTTSLQAVHEENEELREVIKRMESELLAVKGAAAAFDEQLSELRAQGVAVPRLRLPEPMEEDRAAKRTMRVAPSAVACIRDKDGVSFCERLKEEVCSSAYDQLLSEPLFDPTSGGLNEAVTQRPVPIVAGMDDKQASVRHDIDRFMETMAGRAILNPATHETKLVPCNEVWSRLSEHPQFDQFDLDLLCDELKRKAKCSHDGTVLEEDELSEVLRRMEASVAVGRR